MVAGLPAALCAMESAADFSPREAGANNTVTCCAPPAVIVAVGGDSLNGEVSLPVTAIFVTDRAAFPVFEIVNVWVLDDPTPTLPKARVVADRARTGAGVCATGVREAWKRPFGVPA